MRTARAVLVTVALVLSVTACADSGARSLSKNCRAAVARTGGVLWRQASCDRPAYPSTTVPADPVVDKPATARLRRLTAVRLNIERFSEPVYYADAHDPMRRIRCERYPCVGGERAPLTGREVVAPGRDGQLVVLDLAARRSYEFTDVSRDPDGTVRLEPDGSVRVGTMSVVDIDGRGNTTPGGRPLNITGSGLSRVFGLIRAPEVRAAAGQSITAIRHALQVSLPANVNCRGAFRAPATKTDGRSQRSGCVEEGSRLQLDPTFHCLRLDTGLGRAACVALQRYGAFVTDNGGVAVQVYGQQVHSWPTGPRDYARAGITEDYQDLGIPVGRLRVLRTWTGQS